MQFYDYIYRDSLIHKLDPRTKIAWLVGLSFLIFVTNSKELVASMFVLVILFVLLSKLPINAVWNSSKIFVVFFTIGYIILFSVLLWDVKNGFVEGVIFSLKFSILIISSIVFAMSTSPRDLMLSLTKLKVPYKLSFMLTLAIRFVPVITKEITHVIDAQKARAHKILFSFTNPIKSMQTFFPILIPTFHLLLIKAFDLSLSIEARAFRAKKHRTYPPRLKFKIKDYLAITLLILFTLYVKLSK
ncbi:energy-coupling factor transporter transmembrane protein EcfT [Candidatus Woesearchaeota archaeon]|nr:energy-coupling factor transporter transmembrane protein EcfT [Candidatus Woesearchaeota archaeon]